MKYDAAKPFSVVRTSSTRKQALTDMLGQSTELGSASRLLDTQEPKAEADELIEGAKKSNDDMRADLGWQSYLNSTSPGGGKVGDETFISPLSAGFHQGGAEGSVDRGSAGLGGEVGETGIKAGTSPFATSLAAEHRVGPEEARATIEAGLVIGSKVKGAYADASAFNASVGLGAILITDNKIRLLEPPSTHMDGSVRQLARFTSACTPALDLNMSYADAHAGLGMRAVAAFGRSTVFEKYVLVDDLAHLMRRRDGFMRPLIEAASAVRLMTGIRPPSKADMAADMGSIDAMRPGESATWLSSKFFVLGVSAGGMGLRSVAQVSTLSSSLYKIKREEGDQAVLTVRPGKVKGLRLSMEAKVLGDLAVDAISTAGQERSWSFNLQHMSSRHALASALVGRFPGYVLPLSSFKDGQSAAWRSLSQESAKKLPFGVSSAGSEFIYTHSKGASLTGLRLPDFLGGSSLGLSRNGIAAVHGNADNRQAEVTWSHESSSRMDLLAMGSIQESDSTSITSAISIGPKGEMSVTPKSITATMTRETIGSGEYGRRKLARSLESVAWVPVAFHGVQPSARYAIKIISTMSVDNFSKARLMSTDDLKALAKDAALPFNALLKTHTFLMRALDGSDEASVADAMQKITSQKHVGYHCLLALASGKVRDVSVVNDAHDQLLTDFLKAETAALGAKTHGHAEKALKRAQKLYLRIDKALGEISGDSALHLIDEEEQARRINFMKLMLDEAIQLSGDIKAALED